MALSMKIRELVAIGVSVGAHCQPCLKHHYQKALENGVSLEEINEAIEIGKMVSKGAYSERTKFAAGLSTLNESPFSSEKCLCGGEC